MLFETHDNSKKLLDTCPYCKGKNAVENVATIMNMGSSPLIWYISGKKASPVKSKAYKFHANCQKFPCGSCHGLSISDTQKLNERNNPCYQCHKDLYQDKAKNKSLMHHQDCLGCHRKDQKTTGFCQIESNTCILCHKQRQIDTKTHLHAPLEGGECWTCHDPHEKKFHCRLRKDINILCRSCHGGRHKGRIGTNSHPQLLSKNAPLLAGKKYTCTSCHDPHSSDSNNSLLLSETKGPNEICKNCHEKYFAFL